MMPEAKQWFVNLYASGELAQIVMPAPEKVGVSICDGLRPSQAEEICKEHNRLVDVILAKREPS